MNPILLFCGSGMSLFLGCFVVISAAVGMEWVAGKWWGRLRNLFGWLGVGMVVMSTTPSPLWAQIVAGLAFVYWFAAMNFEALRKKTARLGMSLATWAVIGGAILLAAMEFPWTTQPVLPALNARTIYVIGDSMSSGLGGRDEPWPAIMARERSVNIVNLSQPGMGVMETPELVSRITNPDSIVIIEIGGNDLIGGADAPTFDRALNDLHTRLAGKTKAIVMMELPLPPGKVAFGEIQRAYVARGVYLVPKRIFVKVLMASGSVDGLHLGRPGAEDMAREIWQIISPAMAQERAP